MARQRKRKDFSWLGGGLVTLPRDDAKEALQKGRLYCPNITDLDLFRPGSARNFTRFDQRGETMLGTVPKYEQLLAFQYLEIDASQYNTFDLAQQFESLDTRSVAGLDLKFGWDAGFTGFFNCKLWTSSGPMGSGAPDVLVSSSSYWVVSPAAPVRVDDFNIHFVFGNLPQLTAATPYFISVDVVPLGPLPAGCTFRLRTATFSPPPAAVVVARQFNGGGWSSAAERPWYMIIQAGDPPVMLLYDARFNSPAPTQYYMGANAGYLLAGDPNTVDAGGSWDDPIWASGNPDRLQLWDAKQQGGLVFTTDYGYSFPRAWDGVRGPDRTPPQAAADSTMQAGYRSPLTVARAAGGSAWSATGLVQVLIITPLKSGGWRASYGSVVITATTDVVDLSAMAFDSVPSQFYFDIDDSAPQTEVFVTEPGRGVFYRYPAASLTGGINPVANNTTTLTITGVADATMEAEEDLESAFGVPTGYFTEQIDAPKAKYLETFANCLCAAGDAAFPFGVFITAQDAPQIFSEYGRTYGVRLDIMPEDGEPVTGMKVADRALFVSKPHFMYRVDFTGDSNLPWRVTRVHGAFGTYSHWSMQVIPNGLLFLDDSGPALCFGTYSTLAPGADKILNLFDGRIENELGLPWGPLSQTALPYVSSALEQGFNRVTWTMAQGQASDATKNVLLIYDYMQQQITVRLQEANILAVIGDANGFPRLWKGSYHGAAYALSDQDFDVTGPLPTIETPWLDLGEPSVFKDGEYLYLYGKKNSAPATWSVIVYTDGDDPLDRNFVTNPFAQVIDFDSSDARFASGKLAFRLAPRAWSKIKLVIQAPSRINEQVALDGFAIEWTPEGERR